MVVAFGITDYFFDTNDYTSPLKMDFRNDITFTPASGLKKQINVKIRSNIVTDQPSPYPFSDSQSYEFYSINEIKNDIILSQNGQIWRQDYISQVNPSPSCLHKFRVRARTYTVRQRWKGTTRTQKSTVYPPTSYFRIERDLEGSPKTFKAPSL